LAKDSQWILPGNKYKTAQDGFTLRLVLFYKY